DLSRAPAKGDDGLRHHEAIGDLHLAADNFAGAIEAYQTALRAVVPGAIGDRCRVLLRLAEAYTRRGDADSTLKVAREARRIAGPIGDSQLNASMASRLSFGVAE